MTRKIFKLKPLQHAILIFFTATPLVALGLAPTTKVAPATKNPSLVYDVYFNPRVPRLTFNAQSGSYTLGQIDLMYPLLGRSDNFMFLDVRGEATTKDAQEYNLGLGFRGLMDFKNPFIAGGYVWVDRRRSKNGNYYDQATAGLEYLSRSYDVRANIYIPYGNHSYVLTNTYDPFATGYTVGYVQNQRLENSLNGLDIEAGKVDLLQHRLRLYADYYHFGVGEDPVRMNGGRARTEFILENRWLDTMGSNLIFTASYQYDNVRHSAAFAGVRLNIGKEYKPVSTLVGRIEDLIIRDDDIVLANSTRSQRYTDPSRFIFVNNAAPPGGNGSFEYPFQQEITAQNISQPGDSIYTFTGNGPYSMPVGGLTLKSGQFFYGAGADVTYNNVIVLPATVAPILNGRMNITNGNTLSGFTLSGTGVTEEVGIYGTGISNVSISDVTVQDFSGVSQNGADYSSTSGQAYAYGGGAGGSVKGIDIQNASHISLSRVTVQNIEGGSANGGSAYAVYSNYINYNKAIAGSGGSAGSAVGIDLTGSSTLILNSVTVNKIEGGHANGGDASAYVNTVEHNRANAGGGGLGGSAVGIDLSSTSIITLDHLTVNNVAGGTADSGQALAVSYQSSGNNYSYGSNGGSGGSASGLILSGATGVISHNVIVNTITGGTVNSGDARAVSDGSISRYNYAKSQVAGVGGNATGIDLTSSAVSLNTTTISSVIAGDADGGNALATSLSSLVNGNVSRGGNAGTGGAATGVGLGGSQASIVDIQVLNVLGGAARGGDAAANGSAVNRKGAYSGYGKIAGSATGLGAINATITLSSATLSTIQGGDAFGGEATAYGAVSSLDPGHLNFTTANIGGAGGVAKGVSFINSTVTLENIAISSISAGAANGRLARTVGPDPVHAYASLLSPNTAVGGEAMGIDLTNSVGTLQSVTITGVTGGDANGGDADASGAPFGSNFATAGNGGTGGDATGIKITPGSVVLTSPTVSGVVAGTAIGGVAVGNPATQGVNGTAGTATNVL